MNVLNGIITSIEVCDRLSLVTIKCEDTPFSVIIIETPESVDYLVENRPIQILFKETEVILSKNEVHNISLENVFSCTIAEIKKGKLLSSIRLLFNEIELNSIITSQSLEKLKLEPGMRITAMVKTNEIMLAQ